MTDGRATREGWDGVGLFQMAGFSVTGFGSVGATGRLLHASPEAGASGAHMTPRMIPVGLGRLPTILGGEARACSSASCI